jgi:glycosyltransferase involved in cell wall biosynthesis
MRQRPPAPVVHEQSSVCALVPHFRCEEWLARALESLLDQTRPPDAIVVVDDGSSRPPVDIVAEFPQVTLLAAADRGGPYRLVQAVIDSTDFDAYLFQDADDWSDRNRLQILLAEAERSRAELVGSHEVRVLERQGEHVRVRYPLDVNAALAHDPTASSLLHPTSLVARALVTRIGGFATGLRFSGDIEFLRRAASVARVVNADHYGYFRRRRAESLTTAADTGLRSPARAALHAALAERARSNHRRRAEGDPVDLRPFSVSATPRLRHIAGPPLNARRSSSRVPEGRRRVSATNDERTSCEEPVFVIGGPASGIATLARALGRHSCLAAVSDVRWLARLAVDIERRARDQAALAPEALRRDLGRALGRLAGVERARWVAGGAEITHAVPALAELFPRAAYVHVVRDPASVVASIVADPLDDGVLLSVQHSWDRWSVATEIGLTAEAAFGRATVHRVHYDTMLTRPDEAVRECLGFLGLAFDPACVQTIEGLAREPQPGTRAELPTDPRFRDLAARALDPSPLARDPEATIRLARLLGNRQPRAEPGSASYVERARQVLFDAVPPGATVAVASHGDPRLVELEGRRGWHVPQVADGAFAGAHPATGRDAVEQLEVLRARGAGYFAIPASSFWWLEYYDELRAYVNEARVVAYADDACLVYALSDGSDTTRWARPTLRVTTNGSTRRPAGVAS